MQDPLVQQLSKQLTHSCEASTGFTKMAGALGKEEEWEVHEVDWSDNEMKTCLVNEELQMILKESYLTPKVASNYLVTQSGDTSIADLKEGLRKSSSLQQQKVIYGEEGVTYISSIMKQDSWLYSTDIQMEVFFDEGGKYLEHHLKVKTDIAGISEGFHAGISGSMKYPTTD